MTNEERENKMKELADNIEVTPEDSKRFGKVLKRYKERRNWFKRRREVLRKKVEEGQDVVSKIEAGEKRSTIGGPKRKRWFSRWRKDFNTVGTETKDKPRRGLFGRLREPGRFFSKERIKERHDFRIKVSGNRKWIMIGLAVVAVCGTIIYLSVTYGGGGFSFVTKFLGVFK